jgi:hypothetical protein
MHDAQVFDIAQCASYIVHCTLYIVNCELCIVH